ncbi:hypothetical protein [Streptomyces xanthophaeus]|uniref:hypothetical protein n=1 Tax=Streptomyces xanthophaeus TaxID=67385 RepID=UPI00371C3FEA
MRQEPPVNTGLLRPGELGGPSSAQSAPCFNSSRRPCNWSGDQPGAIFPASSPSADLHPEIAGPLELTIAADYLHKANISGGAPYSVWLPHAGADPLVREEEHVLSFTDYLRRAFAGKGFLRLDRQDEWVAHGLTRDHLAELTDWLASVENESKDF